jgi:hypothetical protein
MTSWFFFAAILLVVDYVGEFRLRWHFGFYLLYVNRVVELDFGMSLADLRKLFREFTFEGELENSQGGVNHSLWLSRLLKKDHLVEESC